MKRILLIILCFACALNASAQSPYTFKVEELSKPERTLLTRPYQSILEGLINVDHDKLRSYGKANKIPDFNIVAKSDIKHPIVNWGYHSFFQGMYAAYSDHRPFTLSPDMVWLLIAQGFSAHVNANSEDLRKMFVKFYGKATLVVVNDSIRLDDPNSPWADVFPEFSKQIAEHTGSDLTKGMTADFTTTTAITRIASQITLMDALKSYFDFVVMIAGCGIPEITLEGTPADWERVLAKTETLRKYKLDWWIEELKPILKQFVNASKKKVDQDFWKAMFKYHTAKKYGSVTVIDGWIVKFFPYDKDGKRLDLKTLSGPQNLPNEIVKVDLKHVELDALGNPKITTPLELWAGFVGLEQNDQNFGLRPTIGWMIRKKDEDAALIAKFKNESEHGQISLKLNSVPPELCKIGSVGTLNLRFTKKIEIPDELAKVQIARLILDGDIDQPGIDRIRKLFPKTEVAIKKNGEWIDDKEFTKKNGNRIDSY
ncbi:DUF4419 domain-containing protein [Mucilaginibacter myungsuensis]|uniref:DUF4419 domain-containing protein n=1 Tax=Mucilaginibacter myungsuensis TaxID=649104 RepID=A0A929KWA7_9SPHI|nr:DUF4419 domain-containing protein [Mucilaginibacter myungsuensis]MBE9662801.1 DUF4419 domain-containing protein [Mucilaginibacter myungsuensis]MDN3598221.1 DUF4419 domain-containing protein [Mucilaginibacter myungsuensis]